jgi:hypothetical protein
MQSVRQYRSRIIDGQAERGYVGSKHDTMRHQGTGLALLKSRSAEFFCGSLLGGVSPGPQEFSREARFVIVNDLCVILAKP